MSKITDIKREIEEILEIVPSLYGRNLYMAQERLAKLRDILDVLVKQQSDDDFNRAMRHGNY